MKYGTWSTEMAQNWDDKGRNFEPICGPKTFIWKRLVTRVAFISRARDRLVVVVPALGTDPRNPSQCDITNARLAALVISKRLRWRRLRRSLALYLQYPNHCQLEINPERDETRRAVKAYFSRSKTGPHDFLPTPLLSYLLINVK